MSVYGGDLFIAKLSETVTLVRQIIIMKKSYLVLTLIISVFSLWLVELNAQCPSDCTVGLSTFFGNNAGSSSNVGVANSFFGEFAGQLNSTGHSNSFFGRFSGGLNTTGARNSFFGTASGFSNTTGGDNSFFGLSSGNSNTTGSDNSFFGTSSGEQNTTGTRNSFFGEVSGESNNIGTGNSFFGSSSGRNNSSGNSNSFFGTSSGTGNTTGFGNSFFGQGSGFFNITGRDNSFFGRSAGSSNTSGRDNSFFGTLSGFNLTSGSSNILIGRGAGPTSANPGVNQRLYIDVDPNTNGTNGNDNPLIYGEFDNDFVRINGTFEVTAGLTNPSSIKLKDQFAAVSSAFVLDKINELDIAEWSYKHDPDVRHIGPTAESFYEAFGLGTGGDNISTIDADGVSLIAIQALTQEIADQQEQLTQKDQEIKLSLIHISEPTRPY